MKRLSPPLLLALQILLTFVGARIFGKWLNPVALLAVTLAIAWMYWKSISSVPLEPSPEPDRRTGFEKLAGVFAALLGMALCFPALKYGFSKYPDARQVSDVVPQVVAQFTRFVQGEFPYQPVDFGTYQAFPVYMPLQWLPVGFTHFLGADARWSGFVVLLAAALVFGWTFTKRRFSTWQGLFFFASPALVLLVFACFGGVDVPASYELAVVGYYFVLATGLAARDWRLVLAGVVFCLLSRYTLVFWLPVLALLFWQNEPRRRNFVAWATVAGAFLLVYALPFLAKDPSILQKGLAYHNHAAVDEWKGYGEPPVSWTMERGIHFAGHIRALAGGDADHGVFVARIVQAGVMILLLLASIWVYRRHRERLHFYDFGLLSLYLFVFAFYFFGPLTYRYYLITPILMSAVLCGQVMAKGQGHIKPPTKPQAP